MLQRNASKKISHKDARGSVKEVNMTSMEGISRKYIRGKTRYSKVEKNGRKRYCKIRCKNYGLEKTASVKHQDAIPNKP